MPAQHVCVRATEIIAVQGHEVMAPESCGAGECCWGCPKVLVKPEGFPGLRGFRLSPWSRASLLLSTK